MQKWEYLEVDVLGDDWLDSAGQSGLSVQVGRFGWSMRPRFNALGAQGWELVSISPEGDSRIYHRAFFKRPRE